MRCPPLDPISKNGVVTQREEYRGGQVSNLGILGREEGPYDARRSLIAISTTTREDGQDLTLDRVKPHDVVGDRGRDGERLCFSQWTKPTNRTCT